MKNKNNKDQFLINPDVVLREEDGDGVLLFNPDTNDVKVANSTGLFIWKFCQEQKTILEITEGLKGAFDKIPDKEISKDAEEFVSSLVDSGFLGKVTV